MEMNMTIDLMETLPLSSSISTRSLSFIAIAFSRSYPGVPSFAYRQATECCWGPSAFFFRASSLSLIALVLRRLLVLFRGASSPGIFHGNLQILAFSEVFSSRTHSDVNVILGTWSMKEKGGLLLQRR